MIKQLPNGIELYYEVIGSGPILLMLHGNGEDHHIFDKIARPLSKSYTLYLIDSRNHGQSSSTGPFNYNDLAKDIDLFIEQENLEEVNILGFSDGAITATLLGIQQKDYLSKLILLGLNLNAEDITPEWKGWMENQQRMFSDDFLITLMLTEPNIPLSDLTLIQVPVLLIAADDDILTTTQYKEIAETLINSELIIVPNANHTSYIVDNNVLYEPIQAYLSRYHKNK